MADTDVGEPIGRLDHIGIAVHSIEAARGFFEGALGAKLRYVSDNVSGDFRVGPEERAVVVLQRSARGVLQAATREPIPYSACEVLAETDGT